MSGHGFKTGISLCLTVSLVFLLGCDQLTELKDQVSAKIAQKTSPSTTQAQKPTPAAAQKQPTPQATKPKETKMTPNTLAKVGDWTLTIDEFNERLQNLQEAYPQGIDVNNPNLKLSILEELIRQQLLVLDAENTGVSKREDIVGAVDEFRKTILVREMIAKLTEGVKPVTEEEAKQYYEERKQTMVEDPQWKAREIVTATKESAKDLLAQLYQGADFATIAKEQSIAQSKANGGDLGLINLGTLPFPEMGNALLPLEAGDISSVFQGPQGFYIVKVDEKTGGEQLEFSAVKDDIIGGLTMNKQQEVLLKHVNELWDKNDVKVNEKLLEADIETGNKK